MKNQLSNGTMYLMIGVAVFVDFMQFLVVWIPIVGQIINTAITFFAGAGFWLWFKLHGLSFTKKRSAWLLGGFVIELIPLINAIPTWTLSVSRLIATTKLQMNRNTVTEETATN